MTRKRLTATIALLAGLLSSTALSAQDLKLYAFSSGALTLGKGYLVNGAPMEPPIQVPVGFYVVKHPKGNVLFDTGNNDKIITDPGYWGAAFTALKPVNTPDVAIDTQRLMATVALLAGLLSSTALSAQDLKLYAFSSGALTLGKGSLVNGAPMEPPIQVPVGFYVIKHPKGNVLFDTGNNDKIITDPGYWGAAFTALKPVNTPDVAIDTQLKKIDLTPDDITYVVVSHLHLDHGGNVAKFPKSTLVVQKSEIQNFFWPEPGTGANYVLGDVLPLRGNMTPSANAVKMLQLDGDLDLFGDGTLVVKRWVAHTPGSQMMTVRLKNTGLTILTGDNVYFRENVEKNIPPSTPLVYSTSGYYSAFEWIRREMATQKANFFTAHDPDAFKAMKKAPEFYD